VFYIDSYGQNVPFVGRLVTFSETLSDMDYKAIIADHLDPVIREKLSLLTIIKIMTSGRGHVNSPQRQEAKA